nr:RNA-directed DNA polymerase, eukaryota, reverse transcriptase zinc-binding domain protein [Tanacetum cinerariifolium]
MKSPLEVLRKQTIGKKEGDGAKKSFVTPVPNVKASLSRKVGDDKSYRGILKGDKSVETEGKISEPSIVLGDECVMSTNIANALFGRVKEFASLANLKMALGNEGFMDIVIKYMGELWVMLEFKFVVGRIAWVEVEGVPFRMWTENTFARISNKWGKLLDVDDQDETCFLSKRLCVHMKSGKSIKEDFKVIHRGKTYWIRANETPGWVPDFTDNTDDEDANSMEEEDAAQKSGEIDDHSDGEKVPNNIFEDEELVKTYVEGKHSKKKMENSGDLFNIYPILNHQKQLDKNDNESVSSLKYPSGFTPSVLNCDDVKPENKDEINDEYSGCCENNNVKGSGNGSISSGHFKVFEVPRSGGSMIGLLEEVVKVGQMNVLYVNIQGLAKKAKKDWVKELCIKNKVNFLAIQETKMKKIDDFCVKQCWGNLVFDHAYSEAVGNSGGILCVWDTNSFCKSNVTVLDYFVINQGYWRLMGKKMMIIAVYAPQESKEKQTLWGFLHHEVDSGLVEVTLGGCHFTWCYKSATKMRKLDRFFVSESVLSGCLNKNAITLERFLSDHRPILLKENRYDYGPTPFRFFHHWLDMDGFTDFVKNTWKSSPRVGANALSILMSKLRIFKKHIQTWNKSNMGCRKNDRIQLKKKLKDIDLIIDSGLEDEELINSRLDTIHQLQKLDSLESMEKSQKAKIKWAVEGDENTGFFHEFFDHFASRFCKPDKPTASLLLDFPNQISTDQRTYLESDVTNAEIKKAVWECGIDKSPGPDGFTFGSTDEFQFGKGLKQGDPLSPFLFLLVMETLYISFQRVVGAGMYQGIKVGGLVNLSHMFYADDAVFVGEWSESNISSLIHVLDCFHKVSGLKINMSKSKIMGIEVDARKVSRAAVKLGCLVLNTPFLYLGSYVGVISIDFNLGMILWIVLGGGILRILESIRGKFFNGHVISCKKASWVQWNKVLAPNVNGGLGISILFALNRGLLFKWVWRFLAHESTLWSQVIKAIHGDDGNIDGVPRKGVYMCWTNITNEIKALGKKGINLLSFMHKKLGNGHTTLFWEDGWCEGGKLKENFPRAYALEKCKRITVGDKLAHPCLSHSFRRVPRGGLEETQVEELSKLVQPVDLNLSQDKWTWSLNRSGEYTVASSRYLIDVRLLPKGELKTRWIRFVPIKVNILAFK